jgi:hypothetical protein
MQGGATRTSRSPVSTPLYTCLRTWVARNPHARITAVRTELSLTWHHKSHTSNANFLIFFFKFIFYTFFSWK